ncbi:hypothetical protein GCM10009872_26210 [Actinopolymorpha rutila]
MGVDYSLARRSFTKPDCRVAAVGQPGQGDQKMRWSATCDPPRSSASGAKCVRDKARPHKLVTALDTRRPHANEE